MRAVITAAASSSGPPVEFSPRFSSSCTQACALRTARPRPSSGCYMYGQVWKRYLGFCSCLEAADLCVSAAFKWTVPPRLTACGASKTLAKQASAHQGLFVPPHPWLRVCDDWISLLPRHCTSPWEYSYLSPHLTRSARKRRQGYPRPHSASVAFPSCRGACVYLTSQ